MSYDGQLTGVAKEIHDICKIIEKFMLTKGRVMIESDAGPTCYKHPDVAMCQVIEPYGTQKYYQCFEPGCNHKEFAN